MLKSAEQSNRAISARHCCSICTQRELKYINNNGTWINNIRYADDTVLLVEICASFKNLSVY